MPLLRKSQAIHLKAGPLSARRLWSAPSAVGMDETDTSHLDVAFDKEDLKRRSLHGAAATLAAQAAKFVLRFASIVVMARLLTPGEFGIVAMVAPFLAFIATLNDLGFGQAVVQRRDISPSQLSALFWINAMVSTILAGALMAMSPLIVWIYGEPSAGDVLRAMTVLIVVSGLSMVPNALLARRMRFGVQVSIDLFCVALGTVIAIAAAWRGYSYWSLVLGQIASALASLTLLFAATRWFPSRPGRAEGVGALVRFGANLTGVNLATYFSMTADNMIIGGVVGKVALGLYDRSYSLVVQPLNELLLPITRVAVPLLSRLTEDPPLFRRTYLTMLKLSLTLTMPPMIACVVFADQVILLLLGEKWEAAAPIFRWICVGGVVTPMFTTTGWVYTAQGRTDKLLNYSIVTALISVAAFGIGVTWGVIGVAILSAMAFIFVQTPIMVWGCTRVGGFSVRDIAGAVTPLLLAGAATAGLLLTLSPMVLGWRVVPTMLLSYAAFGTVVLLLPGGRDLLATVLNFRTAFASKPGARKS